VQKCRLNSTVYTADRGWGAYITGRMKCAFSLTGRKIDRFCPKIQSLSNYTTTVGYEVD